MSRQAGVAESWELLSTTFFLSDVMTTEEVLHADHGMLMSTSCMIAWGK